MLRRDDARTVRRGRRMHERCDNETMHGWCNEVGGCMKDATMRRCMDGVEARSSGDIGCVPTDIWMS